MVVIDPGHGGTVPVGNSSPNNARGPGGTLEKALTLEIGLHMQTALRVRGLPVRLTRDRDVNLPLRARAEVARTNRAPVFLSIHFNGSTDSSVQGTETWVHAVASEASRRLAGAVQQTLLTVTGYRDRGVRSKQLGVLSPSFHDSQTACCLAELSFLTDPADEDRLRDEAYRTALGAALAAGVASYFADEQARFAAMVGGPGSRLEMNVVNVVPPAAEARRPGGDEQVETALMAAAWHGHLDVVQILLSGGADVHARNRDGWTALTFASAAGHGDVVTLLLENGADVNDQPGRGR